MSVPNPSGNTRIDIHLEQCDAEFINYCISDITEDGMLPFTLPPQAFPRIIRDAALWFYRNCEDSTQERWYGIRRKDLFHDKASNKFIRLPDQIEAVIDIKQVNSCEGFKVLARFLREPIMYASSSNVLGNGGSALMGASNPYRLADRSAALEEAFTRMYEYSMYKTLLLKGIRFDYNPFSHILNFLGKVDNDIVLSTLCRIPIQSMYGDIRFRQYVIGTAMMRLKKILNAFGFTYPGEVTINFEEYETNGKELVEKVQEEIKATSSASDIILMK